MSTNESTIPTSTNESTKKGGGRKPYAFKQVKVATLAKLPVVALNGLADFILQDNRTERKLTNDEFQAALTETIANGGNFSDVAATVKEGEILTIADLIAAKQAAKNGGKLKFPLLDQAVTLNVTQAAKAMKEASNAFIDSFLTEMEIVEA